ncbi:hypothetical protein V1478_011319 [Vespula squamosa]|uniref:Uncharacterized protein n=1 Tax=Vespula squamosa TaxID=30214 RepID=A0ABD2AGC7_VESSQ
MTSNESNLLDYRNRTLEVTFFLDKNLTNQTQETFLSTRKSHKLAGIHVYYGYMLEGCIVRTNEE